MQKKVGLIAYCVIVGAFLGGYIYLVLSHSVSEVATMAVVAALLALIFVAQRARIIRIPRDALIPFVTHAPRIVPIAKALLCFGVAIGWARLMGGFVANGRLRDSWFTGAAMVLPLLVLAVAAGMFAIKGLFPAKGK